MLNLLRYLIIAGLMLQALPGLSLGNQGSTAPSIYIEGDHCGMDYIRQEIPYLNYARDRLDADIHLRIASQTTGSGGKRYTLYYFGQKKILNDDQILQYVSDFDDTFEERRMGLVKTIKLGLVHYLAQTSLAQNINISYQDPEKTFGYTDQWDYWIFTLSLSGSSSGDQDHEYNQLSGELAIHRITPQLKIHFTLGGESYGFETKTDDFIFLVDQRTWNLHGEAIKSLKEHWAAGLMMNLNSFRDGVKRSEFKVAGGIEYNIYPYSEATRREWIFNYSIGYIKPRYWEDLLIREFRDNAIYQQLLMVYNQYTKWGSFFVSLAGVQYFFDLNQYQVKTRGKIFLRIFRGFCYQADFWYSWTNNPSTKDNWDMFSPQYLLVTSNYSGRYNYRLSMGFCYSFGSKYNNVVNTRFDYY